MSLSLLLLPKIHARFVEAFQSVGAVQSRSGGLAPIVDSRGAFADALLKRIADGGERLQALGLLLDRRQVPLCQKSL